MHKYHIAVIPGDGIGKEVIPVALEVMRVLGSQTGNYNLETEEFPWGCDYYQNTRRMMPEDGLEILQRFDAIFLGAIGYPSVPDHVSLWGLLLPIRKSFNQYVNLRPVRLLSGVESPLRNIQPGDIDFVCVRENTEGEYSGVGGRVHTATSYEVAVQTTIFTRVAVERIVRYAFDLARTRRRRVASITKSNAMQYAAVFWDEVVANVACDYPDVQLEKLHIDAAAAAMVTRAERFDVVVGSNLFIDILSDLGPALAGSLGIAASANINPTRAYPSMFEPVHGSAPDIAGRGIANPIGAMWSGALMLDFLGERETCDRLLRAIEATLKAGIKTRDLGGTATTGAFTNGVLDQL